MLKSLVKITGIIAGMVLSGAVYAVGMGGINVTSALGQPLNVQIDLLSVNQADKSSLSARLASPDAFKGAGIDYPYSLPQIKFAIETRPDGTAYLRLTTHDAVNDPFVSLLVELDWASGKLLREYTFLLDPPGYMAEQPKAEAVQPVEPTVAASAPQAQPVTEAAPQVAEKPMRATAPIDEKAFAAARQPGKPAANIASGPITVRHGDTLTKIAAQIKEPDVTLEQMLVALYRANASQFDGKNMNRLRAGKILRRPAEADFANLSNKEAVKVIHAQAADWHAYRQKLAAASSAASEQGAQQEVSGKISTSVSDKTPAAKQSAKEVLRLSKGEAPGDKISGGASVQAMQDRIHSLEEEAVARNKELQDSQNRIALLEKNIKEMQHLIELKGQPVPAPVPAPEPTKVVPPPAVVASAAAAASAVAPEKQAAKPKPAVKPKHHKVVVVPPPPPPSLLDEIMGNPLYLAGAAVVLLALGGLGFVAVRRRGTGGGKKKDIKRALAEQAGEVTGSHIAEPVAPSPETGDFTSAAAAATETAAGATGEASEEVDPIGEAELFLNFGRYAQAEEVLKEALNKDPNNLMYLLKLLSIYASQKDVNAFSSFARRVKDAGDADAWEQAAAMGRKIDPANPMYGGTGAEKQGAGVEVAAAGAVAAAAVTDFVLDEGKGEAPAALDFDLGLGAPETAPAAQVEPAAEQPEATAEFGQTMKLGAEKPHGREEPSGLEKTTILTPEEMRAGQEAPLDFDITSGEAPAAPAVGQPQAEPARDDLGLDFDITSTNPSMPAMEPENATVDVTSAERAGSEPSLEDLIFDITATNPGMPAAAAAGENKPVDIGLGDISLNLDVGTEPAPGEPKGETGSKDEHWHEVATKLDLAKAYQEMGDAEGAREILEEVLRDGDGQQREAAQALIDQLPA